MRTKKITPIIVLSGIAIFIIIIFLMIGASGFQGLIPGSNLYKNKDRNGYYVFYRLLEELDYSIVFEKTYRLPQSKNNTIVYLDIHDDELENIDELFLWVKQGNNLVLFDNTIDKFFNELAVEQSEKGRDFTDSFVDNLINPVTVFNVEQGGSIIRTKTGKGSTLLISDRSLFNNENMHKLDTAVNLDKLFYNYSDGSIFLREKYSEAIFDPTLIKGLFEGRLSIISIHLIIIFLIFLILNGKRFSKPMNMKPYGVRKVTEHIKATGIFYHKAGASQIIEKTDARYFKWVICRNKKPSFLAKEIYLQNIEYKTDLQEDEIIHRFKNRNELIDNIRSRNNELYD